MPEDNNDHLDKKTAVAQDEDWSPRFKLDPIYKLHNCIPLTQSDEYRDKYLVFSSFFNKQNRTLHYTYINDDILTNRDNILQNIIQTDKFKRVLNGIEELDGSDDVKNKKVYANFLTEINLKGIQDSTANPRRKIEICIEYFSDFPSPPTWYEDGIAYRLLGEKGENQIVFYMGDTRFFENGQEREVCSGFEQRSNSKQGGYKWNDKNSHRKRDDSWWGTDDNSIRIFLEKVRENIYVPLFEIFGGIKKEDKQEHQLVSWLDNPCIIFPIFEIYIGSKGYGSVQGFFLIYRIDNGDFSEERDSLVTEVNPYLIIASSELFVSNLVRVAEEKLDNNPDIASHFLKTIVYIQDWENIWLTKTQQEECKSDDDIVWHWGRKKEGFMEKWTDITSENLRYPRLEDGKFLKWELKDIEMVFTDSEKEKYRDILDYHIICEYPKIANLPTDDRDRRIFEDKIKEQQLRVFEIAINKCRRFNFAEQLAGSAIMARNMSHNIGSHVLAMIVAENKEGIENLEDISRSDSLGYRRNNLKNVITKLKELTLAENDISIVREAFLRRPKSFLSYLQCRMDHLAEIATWALNQARQLTSFNFKHFTDELDEQILLLRYISGKENKEGEPLKVEITTHKFDKGNNKFVKWDDNDTKQILTAIPNGGTGIHAFYIILENYIRNTAKHSEIAGDAICLCVGINDEVVDSNDKPYPNMLKISLWEKSEKVNLCSEKLSEPEKTINKYIDKSILDKNFKPREEAWGITEMVLSARYIRGDEHLLELPILKVFKADSEGKKIDNQEGNKNGLCLMYEFYMDKPKEVLIIVDKEIKLKEEHYQRLPDYGIKILQKHEKSIDSLVTSNRGYRRLVICETTPPEDDDASKFPLRTFFTHSYNDNNICLLKDQNNSQSDNDSLCNFVNKIVKDPIKPYGFFNHLDKQWYDFLLNRHFPSSGESDKRKLILLTQGNSEARVGTYWKNEKNFEDDNKALAFYHRHPITSNSELDSGVKAIQAKKVFFTEVYEAHSGLDSTWENNWEGSNDAEEMKEFYENEFRIAALAKIVILDERIQKEVDDFRDDIDPKKIDTKYIIANGCNRIYIPCNKNKMDKNKYKEEWGDVDLYHPEWEAIQKYIKGIGNGDDPIDCIVIHWGILQDLVKVTDKTTEEDVLVELSNINVNAPLSVLICTGRGRAASGRETIPISELRKWVNSSGPSKYHLCKLLKL